MSWSIGLFHNGLRIPNEETQQLLQDLAEENDHYIDISSTGHILFDYDAAEHMDFMNQSWFEEFAKTHGLSGTVIWGSVEGDDAGTIWGYELINGEHRRLNMLDSLERLLDIEKQKT